MRYFVTFSLIVLNLTLVVGHWSFADEYLRDVPEGHYAYDAVYDLIRRGVTGGFPDGTYRGKKYITRYEIAAFISKFAVSKNLERGAREKLLEELRSEVALMKAKQDTRVATDLQSRWRRGEAPGARGGKADYRLRSMVTKDFGAGAGFKLNLDTMDAGFNGPTRDLVRELLDLEGKVKSGPTELKITSGPGDVAHTDDGLFPADANLRYRRPRRAISWLTTLGKTSFSLDYLARSTNMSGWVGTAETSAKIVQDMKPFKFTFNPRIFSGPNDRRDNRLDLLAEFKPARSISSGLLLGIAQAADYPHGLYLRGNIDIGSDIKLLAQKIGSRFRQLCAYAIYDLFDRSLADGATNFGLEIKKDLTADWFIKAKGDYTDPGEITTAELHLGKDLSAAANLELVYQTYNGTTKGYSRSLGMMAGFKL